MYMMADVVYLWSYAQIKTVLNFDSYVSHHRSYDKKLFWFVHNWLPGNGWRSVSSAGLFVQTHTQLWPENHIPWVHPMTNPNIPWMKNWAPHVAYSIWSLLCFQSRHWIPCRRGWVVGIPPASSTSMTSHTIMGMWVDRSTNNTTVITLLNETEIVKCHK